MEYLSRLDEMLLLAIWRLKNNAYAVPLIREIKERTGKTLSPGALWVSLDNLGKRGLVAKNLAGSTPEIGGRGKLYYQLSEDGVKALKKVFSLHQTLWDGVSGLISENR